MLPARPVSATALAISASMSGGSTRPQNLPSAPWWFQIGP
jgi:hypothetical protein